MVVTHSVTASLTLAAVLLLPTHHWQLSAFDVIVLDVVYDYINQECSFVSPLNIEYRVLSIKLSASLLTGQRSCLMCIIGGMTDKWNI